MISNLSDINETLTEVETEDTTYPFVMANKMDAAAFNVTCRRIESQLNGLYKKIRLLQDIDSFVKDYVKNEIETKEKELQEKLKITEDASDLYQKKDSVSVVVPFTATDTVVRDRDGSVISKMVIDNKKLEAAFDEMASASIYSVIKTSNIPCYSNSYDNLVQGKSGTSFYSVEQPPSGGVQEQVSVRLSSPTECNYISIDPVNCDISNVRVYDENDKETKIGSNGQFAKQKISGVRFTLTATKYVQEAKYGDKNGYDNSGSIGMIETTYSRNPEEQEVLWMEKSIADADKQYIIHKLDSKCDTWENINRDARKKNIRLAGEDSSGD